MVRDQKTEDHKKKKDIPGELREASAWMAAATAASSEINWSAGTNRHRRGRCSQRTQKSNSHINRNRGRNCCNFRKERILA